MKPAPETKSDHIKRVLAISYVMVSNLIETKKDTQCRGILHGQMHCCCTYINVDCSCLEA